MYVATRSAEDPRIEWRSRAACRGIDPDLFFPVGSTGPATDHIAAAKMICYACQVQKECLEFALATRQELGIWGGRDEAERRDLRGTRRQQRSRRLQIVDFVRSERS